MLPVYQFLADRIAERLGRPVQSASRMWQSAWQCTSRHQLECLVLDGFDPDLSCTNSTQDHCGR
jgi:hypothetical protein